MKTLIVAIFLLSSSFQLIAQSKEAGTDREAVKKYIRNKDTIPALLNKDAGEVNLVLRQYNSAVEKINVSEADNSLPKIQKFTN